MAVALDRRLFTVDEYHLMVRAGILAEDDRVELIRGEVVRMTPIGRHHAATVDRLNRLFTSKLGERVIVRVQGPVPIAPDSEPQPDVSLLRPRSDFYRDTPLRPPDVFLVIEVADSSLATDRGVKVPLYAEAGLREAWLLDLAAERVEVHRGPGPAGWRESFTLRRGQTLAPEAFPDLTLTVDDLLG
jgi:Uma2 family endonuclease